MPLSDLSDKELIRRLEIVRAQMKKREAELKSKDPNYDKPGGLGENDAAMDRMSAQEEAIIEARRTKMKSVTKAKEGKIIEMNGKYAMYIRDTELPMNAPSRYEGIAESEEEARFILSKKHGVKNITVNKSSDVLAVYKVLPNGDVRRVQKAVYVQQIGTDLERESDMISLDEAKKLAQKWYNETKRSGKQVDIEILNENNEVITRITKSLTPSFLRSVAMELSRMVRKGNSQSEYWRKRGWEFTDPPENIDTSGWGENEWRKWVMSHGKKSTVQKAERDPLALMIDAISQKTGTTPSAVKEYADKNGGMNALTELGRGISQKDFRGVADAIVSGVKYNLKNVKKECPDIRSAGF